MSKTIPPSRPGLLLYRRIKAKSAAKTGLTRRDVIGKLDQVANWSVADGLDGLIEATSNAGVSLTKKSEILRFRAGLFFASSEKSVGHRYSPMNAGSSAGAPANLMWDSAALFVAKCLSN